MQQPAKPPQAIYVHCTQGADRTGALVAGYLLRQYPTAHPTPAAAIAAARAAVPGGIAPPNGDYCALLNAYQRRMQKLAAHQRA